MMRLIKHPSRQGLTIVELMLALSITVIIGAAVTAMLGAVSTGVGNQRDSRSHLLHANAAQIRFSAYIAPSLCILSADDTNLTLWYNDSRRSGTVHASELRWLRFDEDTGTMSVHMVRFPDAWTDTQKLVADQEFAAASDWEGVFRYHETQGWIASVALVDGLESVEVSTDHGDANESRHVTYRLVTSTANVSTLVSATLRVHRKPE